MRKFRLYPAAQQWLSLSDYGAILDVTARLKPASVLEFGPGNSTLALIEGGAGHVDAMEDESLWFGRYTALLRMHPVTLHMYEWSDPLSTVVDGKHYDMALIDGPRETPRRCAVIEYCLQRCDAVLLPLEESPPGHQYLRPYVWALAEKYGRLIETMETGPLAGAFALLTRAA